MPDSQPHEFTLEPASDHQRDAVWRLLQLYLHDFSEFAAADDEHGRVGDDGVFANDGFDAYWQGDPARRIYLFRLAGALAGFAFVNDWSLSGEPVDRAVAEFFVLRKYRGSGLGRRAAHDLVRRHPGVWELGTAFYNDPALAFWRRALQAAGVADLRETRANTARWNGTIFRFRSPEEGRF